MSSVDQHYPLFFSRPLFFPVLLFNHLSPHAHTRLVPLRSPAAQRAAQRAVNAARVAGAAVQPHHNYTAVSSPRRQQLPHNYDPRTVSSPRQEPPQHAQHSHSRHQQYQQHQQQHHQHDHQQGPQNPNNAFSSFQSPPQPHMRGGSDMAAHSTHSMHSTHTTPGSEARPRKKQAPLTDQEKYALRQEFFRSRRSGGGTSHGSIFVPPSLPPLFLPLFFGPTPLALCLRLSLPLSSFHIRRFEC